MVLTGVTVVSGKARACVPSRAAKRGCAVLAELPATPHGPHATVAADVATADGANAAIDGAVDGS